jgi:cobalamin-dependent methionine synthase I
MAAHERVGQLGRGVDSTETPVLKRPLSITNVAVRRVMKAAVAHLEPHMEESDDDSGTGSIMLGTVKGDVHDSARTSSTSSLSNNGYEIANVEIKQPIEPEHIGVALSEELQLHPKQSTDAFVLHHPEANYFNT